MSAELGKRRRKGKKRRNDRHTSTHIPNILTTKMSLVQLTICLSHAYSLHCQTREWSHLPFILWLDSDDGEKLRHAPGIIKRELSPTLPLLDYQRSYCSRRHHSTGWISNERNLFSFGSSHQSSFVPGTCINYHCSVEMNRSRDRHTHKQYIHLFSGFLRGETTF